MLSAFIKTDGNFFAILNASWDFSVAVAPPMIKTFLIKSILILMVQNEGNHFDKPVKVVNQTFV